MAAHTHYYKILDAPPPSPLPRTLPTTDLDRQDGFIHLSTAAQIPTTANLFFQSCTKLYLLKLRVADLDGEIRIPDDLPGCPHLHDSINGLGRGNVEAVIEVERHEDMTWPDVVELRKLEC